MGLQRYQVDRTLESGRHVPLLLEDLKDFPESLRRNLTKHHALYSLPCTSEYLEELISVSLFEIGLKNDWKPNRSHAISTDMKLEKGQTISVKSGMYDFSKSILTFSGSRLGKHGNISSMVESVLENTADWYICVAKIDSDWKTGLDGLSKKIYYIFAFESECLPYGEISWDTKPTKTGGIVYFADTKGFHAEIRPSMSHQLWTNVSVSRVGSPSKIEI